MPKTPLMESALCVASFDQSQATVSRKGHIPSNLVHGASIEATWPRDGLPQIADEVIDVNGHRVPS